MKHDVRLFLLLSVGRLREKSDVKSFADDAGHLFCIVSPNGWNILQVVMCSTRHFNFCLFLLKSLKFFVFIPTFQVFNYSTKAALFICANRSLSAPATGHFTLATSFTCS